MIAHLQRGTVAQTDWPLDPTKSSHKYRAEIVQGRLLKRQIFALPNLFISHSQMLRLGLIHIIRNNPLSAILIMIHSHVRFERPDHTKQYSWAT